MSQPESRQQAALRIQAEQVSKLILPTLEHKVRDMIDKVKIELLLEMEAEIKRVVKEQVEGYCKSVFDTQQSDYFHLIREQSDEVPDNTRESSPSIEAEKYLVDEPGAMEPPSLTRQVTELPKPIANLGTEPSADHAWYWLGGK